MPLSGDWLANGLIDAAKAVEFPIDVQAPTVAITKAPKDDATVEGTVTVKVDASDPFGIKRVELVINHKVVGTDKKAPYSFKVETSKYDKELEVEVRAYDKAENYAYDVTRTWKR